MSKQLILFAR